MKITIEIDVQETEKVYTSDANLRLLGYPLPFASASVAKARDAYIEARWGDQELRTAITQSVAMTMKTFFTDHWHRQRRAEKEERDDRAH